MSIFEQLDLADQYARYAFPGLSPDTRTIRNALEDAYDEAHILERDYEEAQRICHLLADLERDGFDEHFAAAELICDELDNGITQAIGSLNEGLS